MYPFDIGFIHSVEGSNVFHRLLKKRHHIPHTSCHFNHILYHTLKYYVTCPGNRSMTPCATWILLSFKGRQNVHMTHM